MVIVIISAVYGGEYCNIYTKWYKLRRHEVRESMFADNSEGQVEYEQKDYCWYSQCTIWFLKSIKDEDKRETEKWEKEKEEKGIRGEKI